MIPLEKPKLEFAFDTDGKQGAATPHQDFRHAGRAAHSDPVAYHFPWPGVGYLAKQGEGFRYYPSPIQTALVTAATPGLAVCNFDCSPGVEFAVKNFKKKDFPVSDVRRFIEPGPIVLVSSRLEGQEQHHDHGLAHGHGFLAFD